MINNKCFKLARLISFKSNHRIKIGSVLIKGRKNIINVAFNRVDKTFPDMVRRNPHKKLHSEVNCLLGIDRNNVIGSTMYVYRENLNGAIANCKPCSDCSYLLTQAGVKDVYYTDPNEKGNVGYMVLKIKV